MSCLENIIKLSRTECQCFSVSPMPDINEGQSEIYLDELDGLNLTIVGGAADCEKGGIWDLMDKARENATLALKADLLSGLQQEHIPLRQNYSGLVGENIFNSSLSLSENTAGEVWTFPRIVGGKAKIKRIGLALNAGVTVDVSIYDNAENKDTPIGTYEITTVANQFQYTIPSPILELPLWNKNVENLEYYFVYNIAGFQPKNNKTECIPCSGGVKNVAWNNWIRAYGIKGNDTDYANFTRTNELNGLSIDVEFKCNAARSICSDEYPLDFENDGKAINLAFALRFKAGAILLDNILSSPQINRFTMMDREALYGKRNHYRAKYEEWINWLVENVQVINNDCWICRPNNLIKKGSILT